MAVIVVLGVAISVGFVAVTPTTYEAHATLYVDTRGLGSAVQSSDGLLSRYIVDQATSRRVLDRAAKQLGPDVTALQLESQVKSAAVRGTNTIEISGRASSPAAAAQIADAVAAAVRDQSREDAALRQKQTLDYLAGELTRLEDGIKDREKANDGAGAATLRSEYLTTYARFLDQSLVRTREMEAVAVLDPARPASQPESPRPVPYVLAGLAGGLVLAVLLVLLRGRYDDRLHDRNELAAAAGTPLIVPVPSGPAVGRATSSYELAYAQLAARHPAARTIMVAAASTEDRSAPIAMAVAAAAERAGKSVLLLQTADGTGAATPLTRGGVNGKMRVIAARSQTERDAALASRGANELAIVAVRSLSEDPAAVEMARICDAAILVATRSKTRFAQARESADALNAAGSPLVAAFFVG